MTNLIALRELMEGEEEFEWSFGFGSNMDPAFMESSKGLKVKKLSRFSRFISSQTKKNHSRLFLGHLAGT